MYGGSTSFPQRGNVTRNENRGTCSNRTCTASWDPRGSSSCRQFEGSRVQMLHRPPGARDSERETQELDSAPSSEVPEKWATGLHGALVVSKWPYGVPENPSVHNSPRTLPCRLYVTLSEVSHAINPLLKAGNTDRERLADLPRERKGQREGPDQLDTGPSDCQSAACRA